jgi:NADH-quinone oxidoreductase subunit J
VSESIAFYVFGSIALAGGVNVIVRRNPVHAALFLVCSFLAMAGLFLCLGHALLAAIQVMVYAGAIMVLFLFVIMLLNLEEDRSEGLSAVRGACALAALTTLLLVLLPFLRGPTAPATPRLPGTQADVASVGLALFDSYALPFELVSLLLLTAMVGAIHLAHPPTNPEGR